MAKKCSGPIGSYTVAPSYKATPTMGHSSYQARFQIHMYTTHRRILLKCPPREADSLILYKVIFSLQKWWPL
jgi:hypothetical protein